MKPAPKTPGRFPRSKFGAKRVIVDGEKFDSQAEARRYAELRMMEREWIISDLQRQPEFVFTVNGERIGKYVADFQYTQNNEVVVEDVKGYMRRKSKAKKPRGDGTVLVSAPHVQVFEMKRKLMKALFGVEVRIVK